MRDLEEAGLAQGRPHGGERTTVWGRQDLMVGLVGVEGF